MPSFALLEHASRDWWMLALRGVLAILFGLCAFFWPGPTLAALILLWGAFAIVDGIMAVIEGGRVHWWSVLFFGIVAIAAGLFALFRPGITALALVFVIAVWAIARGVLEIVAAIRLRKELSNEWLLIVSGVLSITLGVLFVLFPGAGILSMLWILGAYAMAAGILMLVLSFRLRGARRQFEPRLAT